MKTKQDKESLAAGRLSAIARYLDSINIVKTPDIQKRVKILTIIFKIQLAEIELLKELIKLNDEAQGEPKQ